MAILLNLVKLLKIRQRLIQAFVRRQNTRGFANFKKLKKSKKKWNWVGGSRSHLDTKNWKLVQKNVASVQFAPAWRCTWRHVMCMHAAFYPVFCDFVIVGALHVLRFG